MTIHSIHRPPPLTVGAVKPAAEAGKVVGEVQTAKTQPTDQLQLSPESLRLQELEATVSTEPPVDMERVKALRAAIAKGDYQVDAQQVAKKMLDFESDLNR